MKEEEATSLEKEQASPKGGEENSTGCEIKMHTEAARGLAGQSTGKKGMIDLTSKENQQLAYFRIAYEKLGHSTARLLYHTWREIYSSIYKDYPFDKLYYVDGIVHLYKDWEDNYERCHMLIAVTYRYPDSSMRYRMEIYSISKCYEVEYIKSMEVTEDERYIHVAGKNCLIDCALIHIDDIIEIVQGMEAVLPKESVPALFSIMYEFVARCCKEVDWSYRRENKQPDSTVQNIEAHPVYIKALAERDVYEKLYKDLLGAVRG